MTATVESFIQEYARRYSDHDPDAVTELCLYPFLAIRGGEPIHLPDRDVHDHFATIMETYRGGGAATWTPVAIDTRRLGEHAAFATVRWNALDADGTVVRDTETTYHLLTNSNGWRFLSYTNHFEDLVVELYVFALLQAAGTRTISALLSCSAWIPDGLAPYDHFVVVTADKLITERL